MTNTKKDSFMTKTLKRIEAVGNKLPHPFIMFVQLTVVVIILSWILTMIGVSVVNPKNNEVVAVKSLISKEGVTWLLTNMVKNFSGFAPFGLVLVMCMGVGFAESSGLIFTFLRNAMTNIPSRFVTTAVLFVGILGNAASDASYVVIPPLGGLMFLALGRNPVAGILTAYIGCAGGHSANVIIASTDVTLTGLANEAMAAIDPSFSMPATSNWYFLFASTFVLAIVGSLVMEKFIEPQIGAYTGEMQLSDEPISGLEKKGLRNAGIAILVYIAVLLAGLIPENGVLRGANGAILKSPFMSGIIPILFFLFLIAGLAYGTTVGTVKKSKDVVTMLGNSMKDMSGFIVLIFGCAQFVNCFNWTNLGTVIAVKGADVLKAANLPGPVMAVIFILLCAFINLFVGSASAKWALVAPIFVPMFALMGYHPAFTQICYRIGDSITNPISPLFTYMPALLAYVQKYDKEAGVGTLITRMLPFSVTFFIVWTIQMLIWFVLDLPLGPGAGIML